MTDWSAEPIDDAVGAITGNAEKPAETDAGAPVEKPVAGTLFKAKVPCWTVIYSATSKDGQIKTGEAYSNAISASAAKADVKSKLSNIGYDNISILAIESCEADVEATSFKVDEADKEEKEDKEDKEDKPAEEKEEKEEKEEAAAEDEDKDEDKDEGKAEDTEEKEDDAAEEDKPAEESKEGEDEEESTEEVEDEEESEELDANKKAELKDKYKKAFKNVLVKCKFTTSFNDLTLEEKVKFFTELSKAWKDAEPSEFMTDKEVEQLNNVVVKPETDND